MIITENPERDCLHCGTQYHRVADDEKRRVYSCDYGCGAYEVITKSESGRGPWWYHGAKLPEDMTPEQLERCASAFDEVRYDVA